MIPRGRFPALCIATLLSLSLTESQARLYRWVDENGEVYYSDHVPPAAVKQEQRIYDEEGRYLQTREAAKTQEEIEAEKKRAAEQAALRGKLEAQARRDRVLLSTFTSVKEIERACNERVAIIDSSIEVANKKLLELRLKLDRLQKRKASIENVGKQTSDSLINQIAEARDSINITQIELKVKRTERVLTKELFDADIARFQELEQRP
ncbi:MAG: DUF4124 domain-containing protein [Gammaproteobacteria bacterium]|jgi:hypothetical protein|nr:DUF4124 domain-containing protein [Gammaproteobacteria bacterium]